MTSMQLPRIDVHQKSLPTLLDMMSSGALQIPRFQRDFVWSLPKTRALLDSIYKEFPIGTFFLWKAPMDAPHLSRPLDELGLPAPAAGTAINYILDGQQRLTSLYVTMNALEFAGRDYGRICLDLEAGSRFLEGDGESFEEPLFVYRAPDAKRLVSLTQVIGVDHLAVFGGLSDELKPAFDRLSKLLATYPFSVVSIQEQSLGDAVEIFQRINQGGKRLGRYDLVCANVWTVEFDFRKKVEEVNDSFADKGFGSIDNTIYTQTFALALHGKCTTTAELSVTTDEVQVAWKRVIKCVSRAVDFAATNLGVRRAEYLPYRGIVTVLAAYFYGSDRANPTEEERRTLWEWFWRVTLSERYGSTSPSRMAEDLRLLLKAREGEPVVFSYPSKVTPEVVLRTKMTNTASAIRNAVICMLALRHPLNLKNGSPIDLGETFFSDLNRTERHHIFPVSYLNSRPGTKSKVNLVPNFCFIPADLNKEIGARQPSDYLREYQEQNTQFEAVAQSHVLPVADSSPIWTDDFDQFLAVRAELISDALTLLPEAGPSPMIEDSGGVGGALQFTDQEARVDSVERVLRTLIHARLTAAAGDGYWKATIPGDIQGNVKERIKERLSRHPYEARPESALDRLGFCDVSDYEKILMVNWGHFGHLFGRKDELQRHMTAYRHLRNAVQHNREPSPVEGPAGEAALVWFEGILTQADEDQEPSAEDLEG